MLYDDLPDIERIELDMIFDYVDPKYPTIKHGVKFTPKVRNAEYSVYVVKDPRPLIGNLIKVEEVIYTWCNGYYCRTNIVPEIVEIDRDELLKTHAPSHQGKKL